MNDSEGASVEADRLSRRNLHLGHDRYGAIRVSSGKALIAMLLIAFQAYSIPASGLKSLKNQGCTAFQGMSSTLRGLPIGAAAWPFFTAAKSSSLGY